VNKCRSSSHMSAFISTLLHYYPSHRTMSYPKSTCSEDMSLRRWCLTNNPITSLSSMMAIMSPWQWCNCPTHWVFGLLWWRYSYQAWFSMAEFSCLAPFSVSSLKPSLGAVHWNPKHPLIILLYNLLVW